MEYRYISFKGSKMFQQPMSQIDAVTHFERFAELLGVRRLRMIIDAYQSLAESEEPPRFFDIDGSVVMVLPPKNGIGDPIAKRDK